jgi:uncharacterized FAD-dependent dehydrogenase
LHYHYKKNERYVKIFCSCHLIGILIKNSVENLRVERVNSKE